MEQGRDPIDYHTVFLRTFLTDTNYIGRLKVKRIDVLCSQQES